MLNSGAWAIRYSLHDRRQERIVGTLTVPLARVPRGKSAKDVADSWCLSVRPHVMAILPRAVLVNVREHGSVERTDEIEVAETV